MKYPVTPEGLAVSPYELGFVIPSETDYQIRGGVEMHHLYHFKNWYNPESDGYGAWRQVFRNMIPNVVPMLTQEHNGGFANSLHDRYGPPKRPNDALMIEVVEQEIVEHGFIRLHNHHRGQAPRMMPPNQWLIVKRRYKSGKHQG